MTLRRLLVAVLVVVAAASLGFAQPAEAADSTAQAADLKRRGDDLLEAKRYEEALAAYDQAYALSPSAVLLYNRGRALQFLARYAEALEAIRAFERDASPELRARVPGLPDLVKDLESRVSTVTIRCDVAGARVLLGGRQVGLCPFASPVQVGAGHQALEAFADGYFPFRRDVDLPGAGAVTVDVALAPRDTSALLVVKSHVDAARASVDGQLLGLVPAETGLPAGTHDVLVEHPGYDPVTTRVVLTAGEVKELFLDPVARPSLFTRWWFWTGVAVVAAGVTTAVVAFTTERSPPSGNFSPGLVRF